MNPLPTEWAIKHRSDACTATQRPFAPGGTFTPCFFGITAASAAKI